MRTLITSTFNRVNSAPASAAVTPDQIVQALKIFDALFSKLDPSLLSDSATRDLVFDVGARGRVSGISPMQASSDA